MFTRSLKPMALASLTLLSAGCASLGSYQSPHTLEEGEVEFQLHPQLVGGGSSEGVGALPILDLGVKYGIDGSSDFGLKLGSAGLTFDYKRRLVNNKSMVVSIDPWLGGFFIGAGGFGAGFYSLGLPVIIGLQLGDKAEVVFTPKLALTNGLVMGGGDAASGMVLNPGLSVGLALELGRKFRIMPEFSVSKPIGFAGGESGAANATMFSLGIGFGFGGGHDGRKYRK